MSGVATAPRESPRARGEGGAQPGRERAWLIGILVVAFLLRLAWALYASREPHDLNDPFSYLSMGKDMAAGRGYIFPIDATSTAYFPVGYPAFVAGIVWLVNHTPLSDIPRTIGVVQAVLGTASVWLVWRIVGRIWDTRTALVAAAIMAFFPGLLLYSATILSETVFVFLALAALAVIVDRPWDQRNPSTRRLIVFGVLVALAALARSQAVLLIIPLAVALALTRRNWRSTLAASGVALAAVVVTIAPVTLRNAITMDAFIPISTNTGDDLCIGHNKSATGAFNLSKECLAIKDFRGGHSEVQRDRDNTSKALDYAWSHPRRELELIVQRARFTYDGDYEAVDAVEGYRTKRFLPGGLRAGLKHVSDGYFWAVLLLALAGTPLLARRRDGRATLLLGAMIAMAIVPLAFFGDVRFHVPASPLFAIAAAVALVAIVERLRKRRAQATA